MKKYVSIVFVLGIAWVGVNQAQENPCTYITAEVNNGYVFPITINYSHTEYNGSIVDIEVEQFDSPSIQVETGCLRIPAGSYEFFATVTDAMGRTSAHSNHLNYTIYGEDTAPEPPAGISARTVYE